ncbi:hypothetical protein Scep_021222 [Stephania cephalantha]|uniref:Uncharacterized protein n=1 Tax=Stephania cephalantha TaxID=152367 RepID=A0AAP0FAE3_9MAGN
MLGPLPSLRLRLRVVVGSAGGRVVCRRCLRSPSRLPSLPLKPSPFVVAAREALTAVHRCRLLRPSPSYIGHPVESVVDILQLARLCNVSDLYLKCMNLVLREEKVVQGTEGWKFLQDNDPYFELEILQFLEETESAKLQRRRKESDQDYIGPLAVDDEVVYYKVAGECPKGRVYGLGSLGRKKRRYADPDASTS